jgi:hypothetical protein
MKDVLRAIGKIMRIACVVSVFAFLCLAAPALANEVDTSTLPPAPPPKDSTKYEKECPQGSFKFQGTCWVQGDCPEGEAMYKQGMCLPIPGWVYAPPQEETAPQTPPEKTEPEPKK